MLFSDATSHCPLDHQTPNSCGQSHQADADTVPGSSTAPSRSACPGKVVRGCLELGTLPAPLLLQPCSSWGSHCLSPSRGSSRASVTSQTLLPSSVTSTTERSCPQASCFCNIIPFFWLKPAVSGSLFSQAFWHHKLLCQNKT